MTMFLNPCACEKWSPNTADLKLGLKKRFLTFNGKHILGCDHPECISKRIVWYVHATTGKTASAHAKYIRWYGKIADGTISQRGYSKEPGSCNCKGCKLMRVRWVREYQQEVVTKVALMKRTRQLMSWSDLLRKVFYYQCHTCGADNTAGVPLLLLAGDRPVYLGPRRQRLVLYPLYTGDLPDISALVHKSHTPRLTCVCGGAWFEWRDVRELVPLMPRPLCPRGVMPAYWWALQALQCRRPPKSVKYNPCDLTQSIATFYTLEALRSEPVLNVMAQRTIAAQRVIEEAAVLRTAFVEGLAKDILTYLEYAVCSELRHTKTDPSEWQRTVHYDCRTDGPMCPQCEWLFNFQKGKWHDKDGHDYNKIVNKYGGEPSEWWAYADHVFHCVSWESGFGGKAWGTITTAALDYVTQKSTSGQFVDRAFNLQHNGGLCFDKNGGLVSYGKGDIMRLLDIKRKAQGIWELTPLLHHLPAEYTPLAERALTLLMVQGRRYGAKAQA